jgi:hypothetical protein
LFIPPCCSQGRSWLRIETNIHHPLKEGELFMTNGNGTAKKGSKYWLLLLLIPFIATLIPQFYNFGSPELGDIPFYYWYQLLWILITAGLTGVIYVLKLY